MTTLHIEHNGHKVGEYPLNRIHIPGKFEMEDSDTGFVESDDLAELGSELIQKHDDLGWLHAYQVRYLWKGSGGKKGGMPVLGKCVLLSGLTEHFGGCDYVIWLGADHVRQLEMTDGQIEALLFHELSHCACSVDDDGEVKLRTKNHDMEIFFAEVERYGLWRDSLQRAKSVFQMALPEA